MIDEVLEIRKSSYFQRDSFFFKILFIYLLRERERERQRHAEGEAGSMQGA